MSGDAIFGSRAFQMIRGFFSGDATDLSMQLEEKKEELELALELPELTEEEKKEEEEETLEMLNSYDEDNQACALNMVLHGKEGPSVAVLKAVRMLLLPTPYTDEESGQLQYSWQAEPMRALVMKVICKQFK